MKKLLFIFIFTFVFCTFSLAQTNENSACPIISIQGPTDFLDPGEVTHFIAKINGKVENDKLIFDWTIENGKITKGQGTSVIEVVSNLADVTVFSAKDGLSMYKVPVDLEVKGLPSYCPHKTSESASVVLIKDPIEPEFYRKVSFEEEKKLIDAFIISITNIEKSTGYFVIYITEKDNAQDLKKRISKIQEYISGFRNFSLKRIKFIILKSDSYRTELHVVPLNAPLPEISNKLKIDLLDEN